MSCPVETFRCRSTRETNMKKIDIICLPHTSGYVKYLIIHSVMPSSDLRAFTQHTGLAPLLTQCRQFTVIKLYYSSTYDGCVSRIKSSNQKKPYQLNKQLLPTKKKSSRNIIEFQRCIDVIFFSSSVHFLGSKGKKKFFFFFIRLTPNIR